jgi:hypothetical protein
MLIYLGLVYVWALNVYPLGRDYALLASRGEGLPFPVNRLLAWEIGTFGTWRPGYHAVNLALLYACMACLYWLMNRVVRGPLWLGTLAAALFMANPVHTESVANCCGVVDLVPGLLALIALAAYVENGRRQRPWSAVLAPACFALAVLPFRENAFLILAITLVEALVLRDTSRRATRLLPAILIAIAGWCTWAATFTRQSFDPARMFAPLYFVFYPLGFLPQTAQAFHARPWLGWVAAAAVLGIVFLIYRKARRPAILFGLLSMVAVRLAQGEHLIDPVHLIGGGRLLLPNALFNVALVALFYRIMDHPKWPRPVILLTTLLCVIFFGMEIRSVTTWRHAAAEVRRFQAAVAADPPGGVLPDYQYCHGAPMCLSESIAYNTAFSRAWPCVSILPLHYPATSRTTVTVDLWSPTEGTITIRGQRPLDLIGFPYNLTQPGACQTTEAASVEVVSVDQDALSLRVVPKQAPLPSKVLPGIVAGPSRAPQPSS